MNIKKLNLFEFILVFIIIVLILYTKYFKNISLPFSIFVMLAGPIFVLEAFISEKTGKIFVRPGIVIITPGRYIEKKERPRYFSITIALMKILGLVLTISSIIMTINPDIFKSFLQ